MERPEVSFTAVYLKNGHGYTGFIEELPGVTSQGQTLDETRRNLEREAAVIFDEERAQAQEMLRGKDVVREQFRVAMPAR
jgi:predicted RNase H-like HicB family nuclease